MLYVISPQFSNRRWTSNLGNRGQEREVMDMARVFPTVSKIVMTIADAPAATVAVCGVAHRQHNAVDLP
jgi:hypothetical protein